MPTILHDNNTDQRAAEQTSREISRNVATALRTAGITQRDAATRDDIPHRLAPTHHGGVAAALHRTIRTFAGAGHHVRRHPVHHRGERHMTSASGLLLVMLTVEENAGFHLGTFVTCGFTDH
ncbi:MAG: hypothetical protein ACOH10_11950 [Rhodoglobus sp.]